MYYKIVCCWSLVGALINLPSGWSGTREWGKKKIAWGSLAIDMHPAGFILCGQLWCHVCDWIWRPGVQICSWRGGYQANWPRQNCLQKRLLSRQTRLLSHQMRILSHQVTLQVMLWPHCFHHILETLQGLLLLLEKQYFLWKTFLWSVVGYFKSQQCSICQCHDHHQPNHNPNQEIGSTTW